MSQEVLQTIPLFPNDYRSSGLLLHVTSLPSAYGVGDLGPTAYAWVNQLHEADQGWWQALPLGPTGSGDSPYQALSTFAGNAMLVSPDLLMEDGFLRQSDCIGDTLHSTNVNYPDVTRRKLRMLKTAWIHFSMGKGVDVSSAYEQFCQEQAHWLDDYALFRALKARYEGVHYLDWPAELVRREKDALASARRELLREVDQVRFAQFLLFRQGGQLKRYAHSRGLRLMGDLPFFVSPDSADVWANPELFLLDERGRPRFVGGVPPDAFSSEGQLWGSPVYNWAEHKRTGYRWWIDRVRALLSHVDVARLDHFRGFAAAWHIPAGSSTAKTGEWVAGPGADLFNAIKSELGSLRFIAEDLGFITPDVCALRDQFDLPGTRVLQFAFDGSARNPHLPTNYTANVAAYTGTHDNNTTRGWFEQLSQASRQQISAYLKQWSINNPDPAHALMEAAWKSAASLAIAPLQDLLSLGSEARMNVPGSPEGNWRWRCTADMLAAAPFQWLKQLTQSSGRAVQSADGRASTLMEAAS